MAFRMKTAAAAALAAGGAALFASTAAAASFECYKADDIVEVLICTDHGLSAQDDALALAYGRALKVGPTIREGQRAWLEQRDNCKTRSCLSRTYQQRIRALNAILPNKIIYTAVDAGATSGVFIQTSDGGLFIQLSWLGPTAHVGELTTTAWLSGATFKTMLFDKDCELKGTAVRGGWRVDQVGSCSNYGGMGVDFEGTYLVQPKEPVAPNDSES